MTHLAITEFTLSLKIRDINLHSRLQSRGRQGKCPIGIIIGIGRSIQSSIGVQVYFDDSVALKTVGRQVEIGVLDIQSD